MIEQLRNLLRLPVTLGVGTVIVLLAALPELRPHLLDTRDALSRFEVWRPWTGHLLHASTSHLIFNLALFVPLSAVRELRVGARRHVTDLALVAVVVAAGVRLMHPGWSSYQGMSGVVYGLVPLVLLRPPVRVASLLIVAVLGLKSVGELQGGGWLIGSNGLSDLYGIRYLAGSHCAGLLAGVLLAMRWRVRDRTRIKLPKQAGTEAT